MKLNKLINFALTMGLMMGALTLGTALAQQPTPPTPDLESKVEAFEDAACTKPIANNASVLNKTVVYVRHSVTNVGWIKAENYNVSYSVHSNDNVVYKTPEMVQVTLAPKERRTFQPVKVMLNGRTNKVRGGLVANPMKLKPENNMTNNVGKMAFTVEVLQ